MKNKLIKSICLLAIFLPINTFSFSQQANDLLFSDKGNFKIIQFTDLHQNSEIKDNNTDIQMMNSVLDSEKPDLVIFTGDIINSASCSDEEIKKGWKRIIKPVADRKIGWVAALGNHDSESKLPRNETKKYIRSLPYNITQCTKSYILQKNGDMCIKIKDQKGKTSSLIYVFDSHDYVGNNKPGLYDWIKLEQIDAYKQISDSLKKQNNGIALPATAFFHIPLPEYKQVLENKDYIGNTYEGVSAPVVNSGLFTAMVEQGDVMGVFVGHDHNNDFIGELHNIALAYGRCGGNNAYGKLRLGARVIELKENKYRFDTWIALPGAKRSYFYRYPKTKNPDLYDKTLSALKINEKLKNGVSFNYYEGKIESAKHVQNLSKIKSGKINNFNLNFNHAKDHFACIFNSYIKVPETGEYVFYLKSDDGAILFIDGYEVVNNDFGHSAITKKGGVSLEKGYHLLKLQYFENYMGEHLELSIASTKNKIKIIPDNILFTK